MDNLDTEITRIFQTKSYGGEQKEIYPKESEVSCKVFFVRFLKKEAICKL